MKLIKRFRAYKLDNVCVCQCVTTQLRNIRERCVTIKRIIHGTVIEICCTCLNIAKTNTNLDIKTSKMPKKKNIYIYIYIHIYIYIYIYYL